MIHIEEKQGKPYDCTGFLHEGSSQAAAVQGGPKKAQCSHSVEETEIEFEEAMAVRICGAEN